MNTERIKEDIKTISLHRGHELIFRARFPYLGAVSVDLIQPQDADEWTLTSPPQQITLVGKDSVRKLADELLKALDECENQQQALKNKEISDLVERTTL